MPDGAGCAEACRRNRLPGLIARQPSAGKDFNIQSTQCLKKPSLSVSLRAALCAKIETSLEHGASEQEILERLQNKLDISPQIAKEYFDKLSQPIKQFAFANNLWYNVDVGEMGQLLTVL